MTKFLHSPPMSRTRAVTRAAGIFTLLVAGFVLVGGWMLGNSTVQSLATGLPKMVANTAIAFILAGISLLLLHMGMNRWLKRLGQLCAILVVLIGALTLSEYLFGWNLGLDQLLFPDFGAAEQNAIPGRPSPQTAMGFVASGLALLALNAETKRGRRPAQYFATFTGLIALLALLGYLYGVAPLYRVSPYTGMSVVEAMLFVAMTLGILLARPHTGFMAVVFSDSAGGLMARRLLPATLVVPVALGWLILAGLEIPLYELNFAFSMFVLLNVVVFATVIWWNAVLLDRLDRERQQAAAEVVRLNDDLKQRASELEASNKELETFSYSVSHDLRAPLRAIEGFNKLLLEEHSESLNDEGVYLLQRVRESTRRMKQLIDDLLNFSRLARLEMYRSDVSLSQMVHDIVAMLHEVQPERPVEFVIETDITAQGDPRLLRIVLENLLNNAWKFTRHQPNPRIEFGTLREGTQRVFFVRDNGVGFDMAYAAKLFGAFQRLHSESEFEGTGIGLATVQRIIARHGGRIWAEGKVDEGAAFYFTL